MRWRNISLVVLTLLLSSGCAWTSITAVRSPQAEGKTFRNVLVFVVLRELDLREIGENAFVESFRAIGVRAVSSLGVLPPTQTYTPEHITTVLNRLQIDAILFIQLADAYQDTLYFPGSTTTTGSASVLGNWIDFTTKTTTSPGTLVSLPRIRCQLTLLDVETNQGVWVASTFTRGNAYATDRTLAESVAKTAVEKLQQQGVLAIRSGAE